MKELILFRHGKSRWDEQVEDHHRSINNRGIERTTTVAQYLQIHQDLNDYTLYSSTAKRAKQTAEISASIWSKKEIIYDEKLYTFSTSELVKWIKTIPTQNKIILFGHNPCFTHFINTFTDDYLDNLWTSGVAIMQFEQVEWSKLRKGKLKHLVNPKEILI
ncbi:MULTISPECIES: histidine phosphatase family protein [Weeksella]|uniref:SixA phosphatase family protein n=1 Tax=Weeksella TaxID=1013 RepID=UPI0008A43EFC|nr:MULTISPECIES: histidine phosphatase family protein [Weeksella]MDK7375855.1 histidine phosphatase family protein [Weeksella virosa]OFM82352.1 hypothetical protein HMPREF2660_04595 [Weeksella sp. HMSC059D05]